MTRVNIELYETTYNDFRRAKVDMGVKSNYECVKKLLDFWFRNHPREGKE